MRLPKSIDLATRLTQTGKLAEALTVLTGRLPAAASMPPGSWPGALGHSAIGGSTLRSALEAGLGSLGRLGTPPGLDRSRAQGGPHIAAGASFTERSVNGAAGSLAYKLYVPRKAGPAPLPLVVMLHGCTQTPDDFAVGTRMNAWAELQGFYVAYPAQSSAANVQRCWNWFRAVDQGRSGEPALVAGMVAAIGREHAVDPARVYVAGLSAGGAAAAVLGQSYPEIFAAVGVHSGLACRAARDMPSAFAAMRSGAISPRDGIAIPMIVFHGDQDTTVAAVNGEQVSAQARPAEPLTTTVETARSSGGQGYTRTVHWSADGRPQSEQWLLHGAGHAWAGGDPDGSYTDPRGPDASESMLRFFNQHRLPPTS